MPHDRGREQGTSKHASASWTRRWCEKTPKCDHSYSRTCDADVVALPKPHESSATSLRLQRPPSSAHRAMGAPWLVSAASSGPRQQPRPSMARQATNARVHPVDTHVTNADTSGRSSTGMVSRPFTQALIAAATTASALGSEEPCASGVADERVCATSELRSACKAWTTPHSSLAMTGDGIVVGRGSGQRGSDALAASNPASCPMYAAHRSTCTAASHTPHSTQALL